MLDVGQGYGQKPPTQPANFHVTGFGQAAIATAWSASTNNVGVSGYLLYKNGVRVATVSNFTLNYTFSGLSCGMSYGLAVAARDRAGNVSPQATLTQATATCSAGGPVNTAPPAVSGTAQQDQTLTSTSGTWTNSPTAYAYQWLRCDSAGANCAAIAAATSSSYLPTSADVSATIRSKVTASNASGQASSQSSQTAAVAGEAPVDTTLPALSGAVQQEQVLSSTSGNWKGTTPMSYGYQWQRCDAGGASCASISGATSSTYTLAAADVGSTVRSKVTAANSCKSGCGSSSAQSSQTTLIQASGSNTSYDQTILADRPVAFWDMSNPSGSETDLTGRGHTGSYKGGTAPLTTMMNGAKAVDFNGNGQYMTVASSADFSIPTTHQLTWEAWIRPDILQWASQNDPYGYGYVDWMGKCENYSPTCEWEARMYASVNSENRCNRLSAYVFNPGAGLGSSADWQPQCNLLRAGQWLHVVGEYRTLTTPAGCISAYPGSIDIWVNGVEWNMSYHLPTGCMSQYSISPQAGSSPLDIGTMALDTWFPGAIGKVAIYNYLLSQSQISAHFQAMTGAAPQGSCSATCTIPVPTQ
jgi:hypothetical protein